jgi:iron complex transport system ATP-binding protein
MSALLTLEDVVVSRGERRVLDAVSFTLREGEVVGLLGPNGAGKSTLLRAALGIAPRASGTVRVGDDDPAQLDRRVLARRAAFLPQEADVSLDFTVREIVAMGRHPHVDRWSALGKHDTKAIDAALEALELTALASRPIRALSAGEQKRALLARCFAQEAPLLVLDEPTSTLDAGRARSLLRAVRAKCARGGGALIAIHDIALAAGACDRVIALAAGAVVASGPPAEALTPEVLGSLFGVRGTVEIDDEGVRVTLRA